MRIAYFTDTYLPQINGVTNTLSRLAMYLEKRNISNIVFAPGEDSNFNHHTTVDTSFSFRFFLYPECRLSIPNIFRIQYVLKQFQPDLIHIVTPFNLGLCGLKYGRDSNIPMVASYHTNFDQYLEYYNLQFLQPFVWEYFCWFHNHCEVNYAPSGDTLAILEKKGIKNLELWSRGVDTTLYSCQKRKEELREHWRARDKVVLLYVGRLAPEKNLNLLFSVYRELLSSYQDKIHLVVTGDGPMYKVLKEEGSENITFTGYKKDSELAEIYASSDIFVFPSCTETFGNVVLEAMASGLPVVAMKAGGVKESILPGVNGFLCDPHSEEDFAKAVIQLIDNENLRISMGREARALALSKSWPNVFNLLLESYGRVIGKNGELEKSA